MSVNSKMTAMANSIRALLGLTGTMGLDTMVTHIGTEKNNVDNALSAIAGKGVEIPSGANSGNLAELIASITGGGGGDDVVRSIIDRSIEEFSDDTITRLGAQSFYGCSKLAHIDVPNATEISASALFNCTSLVEAVFPSVQLIRKSAFQYCTSLETLDLPAATSILALAFSNCYSLTTLILRSNTLCTLADTSAFTQAPDVTVYVPSALLSEYRSATNWSEFGNSMFAAIESNPGITGG